PRVEIRRRYRRCSELWSRGEWSRVSSAKRKRQRANRVARAEADQPIPVLTDDDLDGLLTDTTVRADCEHASTRTTTDGLFLTRCAVCGAAAAGLFLTRCPAGAAVAGGCPRDCVRFEKRHVGGIGLGVGG